MRWTRSRIRATESALGASCERKKFLGEGVILGDEVRKPFASPTNGAVVNGFQVRLFHVERSVLVERKNTEGSLAAPLVMASPLFLSDLLPFSSGAATVEIDVGNYSACSLHRSST